MNAGRTSRYNIELQRDSYAMIFSPSGGLGQPARPTRGSHVLDGEPWRESEDRRPGQVIFCVHRRRGHGPTFPRTG
jgi:hypothetical protein